MADQNDAFNKKMRDLLLRVFLGNDAAEAHSDIDAITGFELTNDQNRPFADLTNWVNERPKFIVEWRSDPKSEQKKYGRFFQGMEACRTGYSACLYHLSHLQLMEQNTHDILSKFDFSKSISKGTTIAIGNMKRCDFEYHAFVMAYRRSLDGLAWGLSTYFNVDQSSYNRFSKGLSKLEPPAIALALKEICDSKAEQFRFVVGTERGMSLRDRMAHKEAVQAGVINLGNFGHKILGGGENLGLPDMLSAPPRLSAVLSRRLEVLHEFVTDIYREFTRSVTEYEAL